MRSLASEYLQEIENLAVSERQRKEEVVKVALGSLYSGKAYPWMTLVHGSQV